METRALLLLFCTAACLSTLQGIIDSTIVLHCSMLVYSTRYHWQYNCTALQHACLLHKVSLTVQLYCTAACLSTLQSI